MAIPSKENIITTFDALVAEGVLIHGPHEALQYEFDGYPIEFRICPALTQKPNTYKAELSSESESDKGPLWGPGSDLYCPDERLKLAKLNGTHDLALNLFCVDRPQYLLLTLDSYKRQYDPLDCDDLAAALQTLTALDDVYVIFNGGEPAGCTRVHRHMQGLLGPPRAFNLFTGDSSQKSKIPFRHFSHHFAEGFGSLAASDLLEVYLKLVDECKKLMQLGADEKCAHNVVLWKDWIIVMPRRSALAGTHGSANAAGMLGSIWVTEQSAVDEWLRWGCRNALGQMGVPP